MIIYIITAVVEDHCCRLNQWTFSSIIQTLCLQPGHPSHGAVNFSHNLILDIVSRIAFHPQSFLLRTSPAQNLTLAQYTVDGTPFNPPTVPILLQILSGTQDPRALLPHGSVIALPHNASVEVSIPGGVVGGGVSRGTTACRFRPSDTVLPPAPNPSSRRKPPVCSYGAVQEN